MKATIYARVTGAKLRHLVPPAYQDAVTADTRPEGEYSLLLFAHTPRDVIPSPPVRKALRRLDAPAPDGILAVGTVFTEEALALLAAAGARPVASAKPSGPTSPPERASSETLPGSLAKLIRGINRVANLSLRHPRDSASGVQSTIG